MSATDDGPEDMWASRSHPVQEDMEFQRKSWSAERFGWFALSLIIALASLGVFANGPLSSGSTEDGTGRLQVAYERFHRLGSEADMRLRLHATERQPVAVYLNTAFMKTFKIDRVHPTPTSEQGRPDGVEMVFQPAAGGSFTIYYALRSRRVGMIEAEIGVPGEVPARFAQIVFP